MPATSANVVRGPDSRLVERRPGAAERAEHAARRRRPSAGRTETSSQTSSKVGPKPKRSCCQSGGAPASGGLALTGTPVLCSCWNRLSFANVGRCVVKRVTCSASPPCGWGVRDGVLEVPLDRLAGRGDRPDVRRAHLAEEERVGDRVRGSGDSMTEAMIQFTASSASHSHQNRAQPRRRPAGRHRLPRGAIPLDAPRLLVRLPGPPPEPRPEPRRQAAVVLGGLAGPGVLGGHVPSPVPSAHACSPPSMARTGHADS